MHVLHVNLLARDTMSLERVIRHKNTKHKKASGTKLNVQKNTCLVARKMEEMGKLGLQVTMDQIKILGESEREDKTKTGELVLLQAVNGRTSKCNLGGSTPNHNLYRPDVPSVFVHSM